MCNGNVEGDSTPLLLRSTEKLSREQLRSLNEITPSTKPTSLPQHTNEQNSLENPAPATLRIADTHTNAADVSKWGCLHSNQLGRPHTFHSPPTLRRKEKSRLWYFVVCGWTVCVGYRMFSGLK